MFKIIPNFKILREKFDFFNNMPIVKICRILQHLIYKLSCPSFYFLVFKSYIYLTIFLCATVFMYVFAQPIYTRGNFSRIKQVWIFFLIN